LEGTHGTYVAGIAVRGNPAARVVIIRFDLGMQVSSPPPTEDWARRIGADYQDVSEYFNTRNVRVVNMSWGVTPQDFELWLSRTANEVDPAMRKKQAIELFNIWREALENAIKNAPNTVFVCSAGNADSDATFIQHVPSAFHWYARTPNLVKLIATMAMPLMIIRSWVIRTQHSQRWREPFHIEPGFSW
jgi:subtilisin family serine protease